MSEAKCGILALQGKCPGFRFAHPGYTDVDCGSDFMTKQGLEFNRPSERKR
jgi:hypothetical protein